MNTKPVFAVIMLICLGGCASGGATFSSKINAENMIPIKKLFFLTNAKNKYFNETLNAGFETSLKQNLDTCGVDALIYQYDKMDLDFKANLKKSMDEYAPDALMTMRSNGGNVVTGSGGNSGTLYFDLHIVDAQTQKVIWISRLGYRFLTANMFSSDRASGERLGDELYNRLVTDGILQGCQLKAGKSKARS
ncbi:MAG TPA: hypothetical protein VF268_05345 [Gammaproteobacteria bacterium]